MADKKISELPAADALAGTEVLPVVQSAATKKATVAQVLAGAQPLDGDLTAIAALTSPATIISKAPRPLFDHLTNVGNVGTGEDDLYSDTLTAGLLAANGDKIEVVYAGSWAAHATATRQLRVYFGGTTVLDTSAYASTNGGTFSIRMVIQRVSASVVRASAVGGFPAYSVVSPVPYAFGSYAEVTGLTLADAQVLKITGEAAAAGAATDDIIARHASAVFIPAA